MGRIAEALKKAEAERAEKIRLRGPSASNRSHDGGVVTDSVKLKTVFSEPENLCDTPSELESGINGTAVVTPHPSIIALTEPSSVIAEQYRAIRTWLLRHNSTAEHRSIAITSSVPQEGKSVTTANLAACIAEVRHLSVLMVDADLRGGSLAKLLGMPVGPGLTEVLNGEVSITEAIYPTGIENLSLMPAGHSNPSTAELLSSRTASALFDELRERFHYVMVDTPPVQSAADIGTIGGMCSGVMMVVRLKRTPEPVVKQSVRWLQSNNLNIIGTICSGAEVDHRRINYPYRYGVRYGESE